MIGSIILEAIFILLNDKFYNDKHRHEKYYIITKVV